MKVLEYIVGFSKLLLFGLFSPSPQSVMSLILIFTVHKREVYLLQTEFSKSVIMLILLFISLAMSNVTFILK